MENIPAIGSLISQYGFPVVVSGALFWYIVNENRATRTIVEDMKSIVQANTEATKEMMELVKELTRHQ